VELYLQGESGSVLVTRLELTRTTGQFEMEEQDDKNCSFNLTEIKGVNSETYSIRNKD
jgi:hypothetical protein